MNQTRNQMRSLTLKELARQMVPEREVYTSREPRYIPSIGPGYGGHTTTDEVQRSYITNSDQIAQATREYRRRTRWPGSFDTEEARELWREHKYREDARELWRRYEFKEQLQNGRSRAIGAAIADYQRVVAKWTDGMSEFDRLGRTISLEERSAEINMDATIQEVLAAVPPQVRPDRSVIFAEARILKRSHLRRWLREHGQTALEDPWLEPDLDPFDCFVHAAAIAPFSISSILTF